MTDDIYLLVIIGMGATFLLAAALIFLYKRYQGRLLKQQIAMQQTELAHQAELLHATIQSQENERKRIGRDLHDGVGGLLSNLKMNINRMSVTASDDAELYGQCSRLIDKTMTDVRSIAHSLSPPGVELFGLAGALEELSDDINRAGSIFIAIENNAPQEVRSLSNNTALMLYRVLQELLANTLKHAGASNIQIAICKHEGTLHIIYTDDGQGVDQSFINNSGMGMRNIRSRIQMIGATINIESAIGKGFHADIMLPHKTES